MVHRGSILKPSSRIWKAKPGAVLSQVHRVAQATGTGSQNHPDASPPWTHRGGAVASALAPSPLHLWTKDLRVSGARRLADGTGGDRGGASSACSFSVAPSTLAPASTWESHISGFLPQAAERTQLKLMWFMRNRPFTSRITTKSLSRDTFQWSAK